MEIQLLVSCMYNDNFNIIKESNIQCNSLIINQTNMENIEKLNINNYSHIRVDTLERGLSKSRNMAISNATGDICLICDDDERFVDNIEKIIKKQYLDFPDADIIIFKMANYPTKLKCRVHELSLLETLRVSSWQISFKRKSIIDNSIKFDEKLGSGTGNGAGEENKFLIDAKKAGLKIIFVPINIGTVAQTNSQWFDGYNEKYFFQRGQTTRYLLGFVISVIYSFYFIIVNRKKISKEINIVKAFLCMIFGIVKNGLAQEVIK